MRASATRRRVHVVQMVATVTLFASATATLALGALTAGAATNPFERGPDPTPVGIELDGPFAVSTTSVTRFSVRGFGGGTIYYPTVTDQGTFGGVAIAPGFTGSSLSFDWLGPRLASHGFVVIAIDTITRLDLPSSRADQLQAALDYLVSGSTVRSRIDGSRLAVMGHSMGGGGTLEAAEANPELQAAIPLAPWNTTKSFPAIDVPTMIIGAENDLIASVSSHAEPFYESIPASAEKAYLELNDAGHVAPILPDATIAKYSIAWLKRFVDNDTRYDQFLCPAPSPTSTIQEYRSTCPHTTF